MKLRPVHAIIAVMAIVITLLSWALVYYSRDELGTQAQKREDDIKTVSAAGVEAGRPVVHLSAQSQAAAGIAVQTLKAAKRETAFEAYGIVANLQPLAELRGRYLAAVAEARAARAALVAAESEYRRMEILFRDDRNVSEQAMQAAQARYRAELSRQAAADQAAASIRDTIRGAWGETVTAWAVNPDSQTIHSLLEQTAFLVQLVLPHDLPRAAVRGKIAVAPAMARENARPATFVAGAIGRATGLHRGSCNRGRTHRRNRGSPRGRLSAGLAGHLWLRQHIDPGDAATDREYNDQGYGAGAALAHRLHRAFAGAHRRTFGSAPRLEEGERSWLSMPQLQRTEPLSG